MSRDWLLIAGGGTAGHAVVGLAVANELVARGHDRARIRLVGSRRGSGTAAVAEGGFPLTLLPGRGINERKVNLSNLLAALSLIWGVVLGIVLVLRRRPVVVLALGGYAALPCAVGAVLFRRPLLLADSNIVPGAANRVVGRFALASAVTFAGTPLPRAVLTGNPVRPEILAVDRSTVGRRAARRRLGIPEGRVVIGVATGSLGSRRVNHAVYALVREWADRADLAIHHAVGRRDWEADQAALPAPPEGGLYYRAVEYEEEMHALLGAADLFVCRAGGSTLAELGIAGVPALLVPLPIATEGHQMANARAIEAMGGAVVVPDAELTAERLAAELTALVSDRGRLAEMGAAMAKHGHRDAAARVADLVEAAAGDE